MKSQKERRRLVVGLYGSALIVSILTALSNDISYPEWLQPILPWFALPVLILSAILFIVCLQLVLGANLGGLFSEPKDERQEVVARRAYSLAYRILGAFVFIPGLYVVVGGLWFLNLPIPTSSTVSVFVGEWLLLLVGTLPKAVAAWLEPDLIQDEKFPNVTA